MIGVFSSILFAQSSEALMSTGQDMLQRGQFSQAVTAFRQVVSREPDNFEAQFNLGFAYLQWGRQSNAIEELKKAQRLSPRNSQVWSNLAIAYENLGKHQESINALHQAVELDPNNITARMNLAAMYANANNQQEAIAHYKRVIQIDGTNEEALTNLSKCLMNIGKDAEAKGYLKQAIAANPNNGVAHCELGNIYWKKEKDLSKALSEFKIAVSVQPENPDLYSDLASAYEAKGDKGEAIETLKKSMIYMNDALQKEKVQDRIDRLEKGETAKPADEHVIPTGANTIDDLKSELRKEQSSKRLDAAPVDAMGDLEKTTSDDGKGLDLKEEAKKRAQTK